jgi:UDP-N-acetylmuramate dehydrogenase
MHPLGAFRDVIQTDAPLAPLTWFRLGGAAEFLAKPKSTDELVSLIQAAREEQIPWRILAAGSNILVRDEGVKGLVIHLESPAFSDIKIDNRTIEAGAAVPLTALISQSARAGLAGLEILTGIPGAVGGAVAGNSGSRQGSIGQFVRSAHVLTREAKLEHRQAEDLEFTYRGANLDQAILLSAVFELDRDDPESVVRRMRTLWIVKKENQPYGHQSCGCVFKDPNTEITARVAIDQAGLKGLRAGGAEISDRHANYILAQPGAKASDVLALIDMIQEQVQRLYGFELELQLQIW